MLFPPSDQGRQPCRISDKKAAFHTCDAIETLASFYKTESARLKKASEKSAKAQASSSKPPPNPGIGKKANPKSFLGALQDVD